MMMDNELVVFGLDRGAMHNQMVIIVSEVMKSIRTTIMFVLISSSSSILNKAFQYMNGLLAQRRPYKSMDIDRSGWNGNANKCKYIHTAMVAFWPNTFDTRVQLVVVHEFVSKKKISTKAYDIWHSYKHIKVKEIHTTISNRNESVPLNQHFLPFILSAIRLQ